MHSTEQTNINMKIAEKFCLQESSKLYFVIDLVVVAVAGSFFV